MTYNGIIRVWRGGELRDFTVAVNEGEVVLDVIHRLQATQVPTWRCAGTARRANAVPARRRSTATRS